MGKLNEIRRLSKNYHDYQIGEIIRYNGKHKIKKESVAEHSFMTALNIIKICKIMGIKDNTRDKAVTASILHDISEKYIGDIAYEFKSEQRNKKTLSKMFDEYEDMLYNDIYSKTIGRCYSDFTNKNDEVVDRLVKLSDSICVVQYSKREIELGNTTPDMTRIFYQAEERVVYDYNKLKEVL